MRQSTCSRTHGGKGRLSKMLSLNARDRFLKGHASVDQSKLEKYESNYLEFFPDISVGGPPDLNEHDQVGILSLRKFTTRFMCGSRIAAATSLFRPSCCLCASLVFAGFSRRSNLVAAAFLYELAWIYCGHGACGDHPFGSHGRGDDQVSKWLRLCDDAFLQAGHPGDDYPIRMQVSWRL